MNINELDSYNLADAVKFHRRLNPRIWGRDEHLLTEVRDKLLAIAADFQEFLGVDDLTVRDITISGSNAAYSYTKNSDIDLHLVVEMPNDPVYQELFNAKKYQYNDEHNIKIGGADVELYVQPADQTHHSLGIYSVKNSDWISIPQRKRAQIDDACVRDKVSDLDARIHSAIQSKNLGRISTLWDKIKTMRQAGLEQQGEFGCENIAFKLLRNSGCIAALKNAKTALQDLELSLREANRPQKKFRYGFSEDMMDPTQQPYSSANGVAPTTKSFFEDTDNSNDVVNDFIRQVTTELGIDPMPEIHLHTNPEWSEHNHSFGRYDPDSHTLNVSLPNRHILDVLRTVAHELVHCSQNQQQGGLPDDAGETGSRWENDANARAGIIMRDWANSHPEHFAHDSLEESQIDHKRAADAITTALSTSVQEQQQPSSNDVQAQQPSTVLQMLGSAMKLYGLSKLTVPGAKEEFTQEFKNYIRAQGGDPNAQNLSRIYQMQQQPQPQNESASGYIPKNKREAAMPQYAMALSVDIHPGQVGKEANKLGLKTGRNGEPSLLSPSAQNLLREFAEFAEEQDNLFEITMSPTSLKKLSAQTGALAGMEFEMIVPNTEGSDDGDQEPDYEYDERCRSIDDAVQFFHDGDWNGRRDVERMRDSMRNDFQEWLDDKLYRDWERGGEEYLEEWVPNNVDESEWNPDGLEGDERQEALEEFIANLHADPGGSNAFDEYREENFESYDESDWLDDEELNLMSAIENNYSMNWPHWSSPGRGEASIEDVADSFQNAVGRDVKASSSYHSGRVARPSTKSLHYIVEPDGSLNPDDSDDQGLEFVSPPLPIEELLSDLNKVKAWADRTGCYTNDSTGLHINVSVPGWTQGTDQLDYVKLALLLGDEHVLESFGRAGNTYAKSAMGKIVDIVRQRPDRAQLLMNRMKKGLDQLATRLVHSRQTEKYTSINVKDGYIEFRSPGGDWLNDKFPEIENTLRRFTVALSAAVDPAAYRQEYLKKLYKLLDVSGEKDPLSYFAKYAAGELPKAALKSFVRQAQLERGVKRGKETGPMWWDVSWDNGRVEVVASNETEAVDTAFKESYWAPDQPNTPQAQQFRNSLVAKPLRPYKQEPTAQQQGVDTRVDYELYSRASGAVIDTFPARNDDEAITRLQDYINFGAGQSNPDNFDVRRAGRAPIAGSTLDLQRQRAAASADADQGGTVDVATDQPAPQSSANPTGEFSGQWKVVDGLGREVYRFGGVGNNQADANQIAQVWARTTGFDGNIEVYPVMAESLTETNRLTLRDFNVKLSPHYRDRAHAKGVDLRRVDDVLFNLSKVKDKIMSLEPGRAFILHDGQGTGLGMRRHLGNRLTLATVYPVSPGFNKGLYPTFRVDTVSGINESIDADQVLQYVKKTHAPEEFNIEYSITDHAAWELKNISLSELNLDPDGEQQDPYNRTNWVDYDVVRDLMPKIEQVLKANPIVVDSQGWIIDGNHRAMAAVEAGLNSVPALVPADVNENFADGKNPGRKGLSKRVGVNTKASVSSLRKTAKNSSGEKQRMAHWLANMKAGRAKAKRK